MGVAVGGPVLAHLTGAELSAQGIPFTHGSGTGFLGTEHLGRSVGTAVLYVTLKGCRLRKYLSICIF